jgi:hypothetical protein
VTDPLVALYRADWTRWSFSANVVTRQNVPLTELLADQIAAEFRRSTSGVAAILGRRTNSAEPGPAGPATDGQWASAQDRILVAPGARYRYEPSADAGGLADLEDLADDERVTLVLSDGESCWVVRSAEAERSQADPALTPVDWILRPAWLLPRLRLTLTGTTELAGRSMLMVQGTPRPRPNRWAVGVDLLDRVDLLVDAELGIIRRRQAICQGKPLSVFELRDFTLAPPPASDPASFRPDDETEPSTAGLAESAPVATEPVSDGTLRLIAQVDLPPLNLSAQHYHWLDAKQAPTSRSELTVGLDQRDRTVQTNFYGTERGPILQVKHALRIASLRIAMPGRYRVDFRGDQGDRHPRAIACDGERLRKVYHNRVIASPAQPLPTDFITLVDPAWLLGGWQLTEGDQETVSGRTAIRVQAVPPHHPNRSWHHLPPTAIRIDLLIDTELGIVLRQVSYADDQPVTRIELREVKVLTEADPTAFGSAITPDLPVTSTSGEPIDDLDLPPAVKSIREVRSGLAALFRRRR